jgi:tetratricopeptide (TPR) repeat protein
LARWQGEYENALAYNNEALARFDESEQSAASLDMLPDLWKARLAAADVLEKEGQFEAARRKRDQATAVIEDIAAGFTDETLRTAYLESTLNTLTAD